VPRSTQPKYRLHKPSGRAVVTLGGKDFYLGVYDSPESRSEYARLVLEWQASGGMPAPAKAKAGPTVSEVLAAYLHWSSTYYVQPDPDTGASVPTPQQARVRRAVSAVRPLYGHTPADRFGPLALKAVRQQLVDEKLSRKVINQLIGVVRHAFRRAAAEEMVSGSVYEALRAVEGLKYGRSPARETDPVLPVPEADVPPVKALVLPAVAAMIGLQLLTACRPGEVCRLRPAELDRSGSVWVYRPRRHKTSHHGHERLIYLGPRAQAVVLPYLDRPADRYCFSPREAMIARLKALGHKLTTNAGACYSVSAYVRAIRVACDKAGVPRWRPHRLRHSAATTLVAEFGWDVARILLGQRSLSATRIYAVDANQKAVDVMLKVG
jgi:integrase